MSQLEAILLGAVQGLTEFLPISSSAHLVAIQHFLGIQEPQLMFDLVLHLGTLSALLFLYGKDLVRLLFSLGPPRWYPGNIQQKIEDAKYVGFLILACIPTGIIGALLGKYSDQLFSSILISGIGLLITGTLLFSTKFMIRGQKPLSAGRA
ncbi:MAG TPA: undecaprenyl-diphosphate phosphatase, partial [Bdellovibrionota bacterium]|nr:undecaprenyl-diphosphate phosphatase [Bdellovibrionota bacterium]